MKFIEYPIAQEIKDNLADMGYNRPTDIQYKAIPPILRGEDVLAIAQTGTGKTAAFAIPIVHKLGERKVAGRFNGIRCLVMAPSHELAMQIADVFKQIAKGTKVKTLCMIGGVDQEPQIKKLNKGVDVLVATPGRMFDLQSQGYLRLDKVEVLILDEADYMLDLGFYKDIQDIIERLPRRRQTLYFSATIDDKIKKLAYSIVKKPIRIQISPKNPVNKNIKHAVGFVEMDDKRFFLERLIRDKEGSKILVFVRTKVRAERVVKAMERVEIVSDSIHSDKTQKERSDVMNAFRSGRLKILIATDVSARGIDIPNVDYVVNYDLPESGDQYVHRVGRTGRGRLKGRAISFCSKGERGLLEEIHAYLGEPIETMKINRNDVEETKDLSLDLREDWRGLMKEIQEEESSRKRKKRRK